MIEPLLAEVRRLQEVMTDHGEYLKGTEAATRAAVIDPVLSMLGWDVHDLAAVQPEDRVGASMTKFADYALLRDGQLAALIEAKKLGDALDVKAQEQLSNYCINCRPHSVRWGLLTSGDQWILIDAFDVRKALTERIVQRFTRRDVRPLAALQELITLFGMISGETDEPVRPTDTTRVEPAPVVPDPPVFVDPPPVVSVSRPLEQLQKLVKDNASIDLLLTLPDGQQVTISKWSHLLQSAIEYFIRTGAVTPAQCPIPDASDGKWTLINTQPTHRDGSTMMRGYRQTEGLFYQLHYERARVVRNTLHILQVAGIDPATVTWQGIDGWPEHDLGE